MTAVRAQDHDAALDEAAREEPALCVAPELEEAALCAAPELERASASSAPVDRSPQDHFDIARAGLGYADGEPRTPYERALTAVLETLGWRGAAELIEAAPHGTPIADGAALRATLRRLGYVGAPRHLALRRCDESAFPLLYHGRDGLRLARARRDDGRLETVVFPSDGADGRAEILPAPRRAVETLSIREAGAFDAGADDLDLADLGARGAARGVLADAGADGAPVDASWLFDQLRALRDPIVGALGLTLFINLFAVATPLYSMAVYNLVIPGESLDTLVFVTAILGGALWAEDALRRARGRLAAMFAARLHTRVMSAGFAKLLALPVGRIESAPEGAQHAQLRRFETMTTPLHGPLAVAMLDAPFAVIFIALIAALAGPLAFAPLALGAVLLCCAALTGPAARRMELRRMRVRREAQDLIRESVTARREIRALGAEEIWRDRLEAALAREAEANAAHDAAEQIAGHAALGAVAVAAVMMLGFGALAAIDGSLSIGALIAVIMLMWKALGPFQTAFLALRRIRAMREDAELIDQLMRLEEERRPGASSRQGRSAPTGAALSFKSVSYRPRGARDFALRGVSFTLAPGERVGVMGSGGAGRSLLLRLALGLDAPNAGSVALEGAAGVQSDPAQLRAAAALAAQEPDFGPAFGEATLADHLRLWRCDLSDAELEMTLDALETPLDPVLFPDGLKTILSAGRRALLGASILQRLSLARALMSDRPLLILDEPTAQLDAPARAAFLGQLQARPGRTALIASNDAALLGLCDHVLVLAQGRIAAEGAPQDVFEQLGKNARNAS